MIELVPDQLPPLTRWPPAGSPGPTVVGEHVLSTGIGHWWADRPVQPRAIAVSCAGFTVLRGTPDVLTREAPAPLAHRYIDAPARFLPTLRAAFDRLTPWERMVWTLQADPQPAPTPRDATVRRLGRGDADALAALGPEAERIHTPWGGPASLASSGHGWTAVDATGRLLAVACTHFRGTRYEDAAVFTLPQRRRHGLGLAVSALPARTSPHAVTSRAGTARSTTGPAVCSPGPRVSGWCASTSITRREAHSQPGETTCVMTQRVRRGQGGPPLEPHNGTRSGLGF
ncbi:GNAT family N-acetyltransferase [Streptomyces sp. NPDC001156]